MRKLSEIRTVVDRLLRQNRVTRPPVPVDRIAEAQGLAIRFLPLDGELSGALIRERGEAYIGVNSLQSPNRRRFTIAHELAHFMLHKGIEVHYDRDFRVNWRNGESSRAVNPEEMEANRFAAELLMPTEMLIRDVEALPRVDQPTIDRLARRYRVSGQAMGIRLGNFGFIVSD